MNATIKIEEPSQIEVTVKITAKMGAWRQIKNVLDESVQRECEAMSGLRQVLTSLIEKAEKEFWTTAEEEEK